MTRKRATRTDYDTGMKKLTMRVDELIERKAIIDKRHIRIKDVEAGTGISARTLYGYRNGLQQPTLDSIEALCLYFDVEPNDLLIWVDVDDPESA